MVIYYETSTGEILAQVLGDNTVLFDNTNSINVPYTKMFIDNIPDNGSLLAGLSLSSGKKDINGVGRYYVKNGELTERDPWVVNDMGAYM